MRSSRCVEQWYTATSNAHDQTAERLPAGSPASLEQVLALALRPFLARCSRRCRRARLVLVGFRGLDGLVVHRVSAGAHRALPVLRLGTGLRRHHAERRSAARSAAAASAQWPFAPLTCPFCANDDRALITSFATRDGRYRVYACDVCRRYLKAYDAETRLVR